MNSVDDCLLIELPRIGDRGGNLTPVDGLKTIPFEIKRVFYLYDIPGGASRAGHAHKEAQQFLVSVLGSFTVTLRDGTSSRELTLNRPYFGIYVPSLIWAELSNFSSGAICLVLTSTLYDPDEYVRTMEEMIEIKGKQDNS